MKIVIDCRMLGSGGIGSYLAALIPEFLSRSEQCLLLLNPADAEAYRIYKNAEICICPVQPFSIKELFSFPRDILHLINTYDLYYSPYCNIPGGIHIPIYTTIHDIVFLDIPGLSSKLGILARTWFYQHAIHRSEIIFTVSQFSAHRIQAKLHCKKSIVITYNALPPWFSSLPSKSKTTTAKTDTILFVGNIKKHKGLHVLLEGFQKAREKGLSAKLVITGNADNFRTGDTSITQKLDKMPAGSVIFTGRISDSALRQQYQEAKLLVQPSFYEGFGMPPLEALALGTNVLLSDIPVFREIYKDFPVTFFTCGDPDDLCSKLLALTEANTAIPAIPAIYSFKKTAGIIWNAFTNLSLNSIM